MNLFPYDVKLNLEIPGVYVVVAAALIALLVAFYKSKGPRS
jgi:hypothetical protein